jgi:hypothetical protein
MPRRLTPDEQDRYRRAGWVTRAGAVPDAVLAPAREIANRLAGQTAPQDMLSGIHNPFGYHACVAQAWFFLDIAEDAILLDCVQDVMGPDIILWDSELYLDHAALPLGEAPLWPVEPLAGTVAVITLHDGDLFLIEITRLTECSALLRPLAGARYVLRYMPATSQFQRDPSFAANQRGAEIRPLVNYSKRPIWLVRGEDRRENDFSIGFSVPAARWIDQGILNYELLDRGDHSQSNSQSKGH